MIAYFSDPLFLNLVLKKCPEHSAVLLSYARSPGCSSCVENMRTLCETLQPRMDEFVSEYMSQYGRAVQIPSGVAIRTPLTGERVVSKENYKTLIKELMKDHTWTSLKVIPQGDQLKLVFG